MAGASRVAIRKGATLSYMLADHLGSTSLVTDVAGNRTSEMRYKPWGESRFSFGTLPTKYTFTGQFSYTDDPSTPQAEGFGLMYFGARWVDVSLGRFAQADTRIPNGPQGYDRYAYSNNSPITYIDPSGHDPITFLVVAVLAIVGASLLSGCASSPQDQVQAAIDKAKASNPPDKNAYQVAINLAVDKYNLSTEHMKGGGPVYDSDLDPQKTGHTDPDGTSRIGPSAFKDADTLIGTVFHEGIHATQASQGRMYQGLLGKVLNEIEAYGKELNFAEEHGFSESYRNGLKAILDSLYNQKYSDGTTPVLPPYLTPDPNTEIQCYGPDCDPYPPSGQ